MKSIETIELKPLAIQFWNTLKSKHTDTVRATSGQVCFIKKNDLDEQTKFSENIRLNKDIEAQCW